MHVICFFVITDERLLFFSRIFLVLYWCVMILLFNLIDDHMFLCFESLCRCCWFLFRHTSCADRFFCSCPCDTVAVRFIYWCHHIYWWTPHLFCYPSASCIFFFRDGDIYIFFNVSWLCTSKLHFEDTTTWKVQSPEMPVEKNSLCFQICPFWCCSSTGQIHASRCSPRPTALLHSGQG